MRTFELESAANSVAALVVLVILLSVAIAGVRVVETYGAAGVGIVLGVLALAVVAAALGTVLLKSAFVGLAHLIGRSREAALSIRRRLRSR